MLQQTQVARVVEKFGPFLERFPTVHALAEAPIDDVLALWSGLGYYRRARSLHACAQAIVERFGTVPASTDDLQTLPGIGRYTGGAIASIVFDQPSPIVDGNVTRVLLRIEGRDLDPMSPEAGSLCWERADDLVRSASRSKSAGVSVGAFNEALMELGALVCTPRSPACDGCPFGRWCTAKKEGRQDEIPRPRRAAAKQTLHMAAVVVRDLRGRVLVEQRPDSGLWAGLWQPPTLESDGPVRKSGVARHFGLASRDLSRDDVHSKTLVWETSHRTVRVSVYRSDRSPDDDTERRWCTKAQLEQLALGSLQRRLLLND